MIFLVLVILLVSLANTCNAISTFIPCQTVRGVEEYNKIMGEEKTPFKKTQYSYIQTNKETN